MSTMKAIKRRIGSVKNTQQIMKAMNLVAASKLQKARGRMDTTRPMFDKFKKIIEGVKVCGEDIDNVFTKKREVKNIAYIVITSDRGLCGAYNTSVAKEAYSFMGQNADKGEHILAVGSKGYDYFRRRGKNIVYRHQGSSENMTFEDAADIGNKAVRMFKRGDVDEVYVVYTHFLSMLSSVPQIDKILPIDTQPSDKSEKPELSNAAGKAEPAQLGEEEKLYTKMEYDPNINEFIKEAVPLYLKMYLYGAMIESVVCEHVSRMTSMEAASRNAEEIHEDLKLEYNRKRQGLITQEIIEIVSGASALN